MTSRTSSGRSASVASPTDSSTRWVPGSGVLIAAGQVHSPCPAASRRAAAVKSSAVVRSSRCSMGVCGGSGTIVTPGRSRSASAMARVWLR